MGGCPPCLWGLLGGHHGRARHALQHNRCVNSSVSHYAGIFPANNETVSVDIYQGVSDPGLCPVGIRTHSGDTALPPIDPWGWGLPRARWQAGS